MSKFLNMHIGTGFLALFGQRIIVTLHVDHFSAHRTLVSSVWSEEIGKYEIYLSKYFNGLEHMNLNDLTLPSALYINTTIPCLNLIVAC